MDDALVSVIAVECGSCAGASGEVKPFWGAERKKGGLALWYGECVFPSRFPLCVIRLQQKWSQGKMLNQISVIRSAMILRDARSGNKRT
jgi:hypothetical protein